MEQVDMGAPGSLQPAQRNIFLECIAQGSGSNKPLWYEERLCPKTQVFGLNGFLLLDCLRVILVCSIQLPDARFQLAIEVARIIFELSDAPLQLTFLWHDQFKRRTLNHPFSLDVRAIYCGLGTMIHDPEV